MLGYIHLLCFFISLIYKFFIYFANLILCWRSQWAVSEVTLRSEDLVRTPCHTPRSPQGKGPDYRHTKPKKNVTRKESWVHRILEERNLVSNKIPNLSTFSTPPLGASRNLHQPTETVNHSSLNAQLRSNLMVSLASLIHERASSASCPVPNSHPDMPSVFLSPRSYVTSLLRKALLGCLY